MQDPNDFEFADDQLERKIKAAYDAVEPSEEAQERMLANLLAYRDQLANAQDAPQDAPVAPDAAPVAPQAFEPASAAATPAQPSSEALEAVREAREAAPKPKRIIRPWKVLVPAAAVLAVVGIALASGSLMGGMSGGSATAPTQQVAMEAVSEEAIDKNAAEEELDGVAPEAAEDDGQSAEEGAPARIENSEAYQALSGDALEPIWAHEFPNITTDSGLTFAIDSPQAPVAANPAIVGNLLSEGVATDAQGTAEVPCAVYSSLVESAEYLVSYNGEEVYYPAHALH